MSEKEKARTGAAASERAMKYDSGINYSTEARASQGWIVDFLLTGRENALTGREIAQFRDVRNGRFQKPWSVRGETERLFALLQTKTPGIIWNRTRRKLCALSTRHCFTGRMKSA